MGPAKRFLCAFETAICYISVPRKGIKSLNPSLQLSHEANHGANSAYVGFQNCHMALFCQFLALYTVSKLLRSTFWPDFKVDQNPTKTPKRLNVPSWVLYNYYFYAFSKLLCTTFPYPVKASNLSNSTYTCCLNYHTIFFANSWVYILFRNCHVVFLAKLEHLPKPHQNP